MCCRQSSLRDASLTKECEPPLARVSRERSETPGAEESSGKASRIDCFNANTEDLSLLACWNLDDVNQIDPSAWITKFATE